LHYRVIFYDNSIQCCYAGNGVTVWNYEALVVDTGIAVGV